MAPPRPRPLPPPPGDLDLRVLPVVSHRDVLIRIYALARAPDFWGTTTLNRFDAPAGEFGVLYAAADRHGAFIETYGDTLDRTITEDSLAVRGWAQITPVRPLRLVDLSGNGLARIGADGRLCDGDHTVAQRWSLALWRHPASVDGLYYRARHDPSRMSVALFDRAATAVHVVPDGRLMDSRHADLLGNILDEYDFSILQG